MRLPGWRPHECLGTGPQSGMGCACLHLPYCCYAEGLRVKMEPSWSLPLPQEGCARGQLQGGVAWVHAHGRGSWGSRRGRRLAAALFNKITDAGVACVIITQHQDIVGEDGLCRHCADGLCRVGAGRAARPSPLLPARAPGSRDAGHPGLSLDHQRQDRAAPPAAGPAQPPPLWHEGNRLGLRVGPKCG